MALTLAEIWVSASLAPCFFFPIASNPYFRNQYETVEAAYAGPGYDLPHSEEATDRGIILPMYPGMPDDQLDFVCQALDTAVRSSLRASGI